MRPAGASRHAAGGLKASAMRGYAHGIAPDVVKPGQDILDQKDKTIGEVKDEFLELLFESKLATVGELHSSMLITHPKNRGSLLLNWNNVHRNGTMIQRVGAHFKELHNTVCIELSPDPAKRKDCCRTYALST